MTESDKKNRPFPIQCWSYRNVTGEMIHVHRSFIPWWLAEEAYKKYVALFGKIQSLERIAERGGFGNYELIKLLRRESFHD